MKITLDTIITMMYSVIKSERQTKTQKKEKQDDKKNRNIYGPKSYY